MEEMIVAEVLMSSSLHLIIIVRRNTSRANAESSQLDRSQRAVGVGDRREDRDIEEFLERHIPLAVNNLLVVPHNLKVLIHHIQTLISALACGGAEGAPPLRVVRERVATEELAREALGSLGIAG
jgi:hypothetical protein